MSDLIEISLCVSSAKEIYRCFCDLDNWEPEKTTGHSCVCPIHHWALHLHHKSAGRSYTIPAHMARPMRDCKRH